MPAGRGQEDQPSDLPAPTPEVAWRYPDTLAELLRKVQGIVVTKDCRCLLDRKTPVGELIPGGVHPHGVVQPQRGCPKMASEQGDEMRYAQAGCRSDVCIGEAAAGLLLQICDGITDHTRVA